MKFSLRKLPVAIMSGIMALLGFTSCDDEGDDMVMYGTPHADYSVSGLVTDTEGTPVEGVRVIVRTDYDYDKPINPYLSDTVYTDKDGKFLNEGGMFPEKSVKVVCQDPDGNFASDSTIVDLEYDKKKADGWYKGIGRATVDFKLNKQDKE